MRSSGDLAIELNRAKADVHVAREIVHEAKIPLDRFEALAKAAWGRRKAALASLQITERGAAGCGLRQTASTKAVMERYRQQAQQELETIHNSISLSRQTCEIFEWAWDSYLTARSREVEILAAIIETTQSDVSASLETSEIQAYKEDLAMQKQEITKEKAQRNRELGFPDEAHYDPQYDDQEILERRMRPWV